MPSPPISLWWCLLEQFVNHAFAEEAEEIRLHFTPSFVAVSDGSVPVLLLQISFCLIKEALNGWRVNAKRRGQGNRHRRASPSATSSAALS